MSLSMAHIDTYVCMYVRMYVCMYICIYIYICMWVIGYDGIYMRYHGIFIRINVNECIYIYIHIQPFILKHHSLSIVNNLILQTAPHWSYVTLSLSSSLLWYSIVFS